MPSTTHCDPVSLPGSVRPLLPGKNVFCSFSGGADSLALLLALQEWSRSFSFSLRAVHFEHGLRGVDSLDDARFCREFCEHENIPFLQVDLDVPAHRLPGEGDEAAARRLRLIEWRRIVEDPARSLIALGHHADDRIENVLLRLFRGSNASGLSSLRAVQKIGRLTLIRPLIETTRAQIEGWLTRRGVTSWRHDATNDSERYRRNFLRLKLLPAIREQFPFAPDGILRSVRTLESDALCLEQLAREELDGMGGQLQLSRLETVAPALRARILRLFLRKELHDPSFIPDSRLIERFEKMLAAPRPSARIPIRGVPGSSLVLQHGAFCLLSDAAAAPEPAVWDPFRNADCVWGDEFVFHAELLDPDDFLYPQDRSSAFFDADQMEELMPLELTVWRTGDAMIPFGKEHPVRLKKLFTDAGVASSERSGYPVIRGADGSILWVAGLRNSNIAPVTPETAQVLRLSLV
ncbi:MAG: tRNA lysidine(34) synthetase TilS [Lentisphaeria bacterium]|nr:tRNA lysidine(34) synthetase TilS [Lentisphaeria bacterium]